MEPNAEEILDPARASGTLADILAVIESAKARGGVEGLEKHIAKSLRQAEQAEVEQAAEVALEVIESIPIFLARARQEARARGLTSVVNPLLDHAERYYLQPMDLIPEMTQGLPGLLDDTYLVLRMLQNLERGPEPFLDWDLDDPARFLQRLIGADVAERIDRIAAQAMEEVSAHLADLWQRMAHPA